MELLPGARWYAVDRADARLYALYRAHYSAEKNAAYRRPGNTNCVGPGAPLCLLTVPADAAFIWLRNTAERFDHQEGVCCTLFRNEGPYRASELILDVAPIHDLERCAAEAGVPCRWGEAPPERVPAAQTSFLPLCWSCDAKRET